VHTHNHGKDHCWLKNHSSGLLQAEMIPSATTSDEIEDLLSYQVFNSSVKFITWLESLPQCKPKDHPEFITWLDLLPQRKPKDHPEYKDWLESLLESLPQRKPKDHPEYKDWLESLLESLPQCKPKNSPEFITWLESLPQRKPKDHPEFITWLESLPQCKPEGHPDRVEWELSLSGIPFDERMKDVKEYKEKFGDCNVSQYQEGYESLGSWVNNIWQAKKHLGQKKQKGDMNLTDGMIDSFNDIGFEWTLKKSFNERMKDLKEYKEQFGDCNVSSMNTSWVANMRNARKG